jgi:hypothetical protein
VKIWVDDHPIILSQKVTILGRDPRADIAVLHAEVSRKHAVVVALGDDRYLLMDFKSANGTRLNGDRIEAAEIRDGDQIDLAGAILGVEDEHSRRGSLAATGRYKNLMDLEEMRSNEVQNSSAVFWSERLPEISPLLPRIEAIRRNVDLDEVSLQVLGTFLEGVGAARGLLLLLDDEGSSLRLKCEFGYPNEQGIRRNLHQAMIDEAVDNNRIVTAGLHFLEEVFAVLRPSTNWRQNLASAIAAPLMLGDLAVGAVFLDRPPQHPPFAHKDRTMLRFLSQLCAPQLATLLLQKQFVDQLSQVDIVDVFLSRTLFGNCEICGDPLTGHQQPLVRCSECQTSYHEDCWGFMGKCAIFACDSPMATLLTPPSSPG